MDQVLKDYITIGSKISQYGKLDWDFEKYGELGKEFCKFAEITGKDDIHYTAKRLSAGYGKIMIQLAIFLSSQIVNQVITNKIPIRLNGSYCTIMVFHNVDYGYLASTNEHYGYLVDDMVGSYPTFMVVDDLESFMPRAGTKVLEYITQHTVCPIAIQAGFLHCGDYQEFEETRDFSKIKSLVFHYEGVGFENVNKEIGQLEEAVAMLYIPRPKKQEPI